MTFDARAVAHRFIVCGWNIGDEHNGICDELTAAIQSAYDAGRSAGRDEAAHGPHAGCMCNQCIAYFDLTPKGTP